MTDGAKDLACSEQSRAAQEPLAGTAAHGVDHWLVLEVRGVWERKVLDCLALGDVRTLLERWEKQHPRLRIQLIRRPEDHEPDGTLRVFVATVTLDRRQILAGTIDSPRELEEVDIDAVLTAGRDPAGRLQAWSQPLFLVCGHGRRDRSCGRRGTPIYQRLRELAPTSTWQTSHTGGHRFAPTLIHLPSGLCYGRVEAEECSRLVESAERDEVYDVERLRGRCCLGRAGQAAEVDSIRGDPEFRLASCSERPEEDGSISVTLGAVSGAERVLRLRYETLDQPGVESSCGSQKIKPVGVWALA